MKEKFDSNEYVFSDEELERIIEISPQQHKDSLCGNDRFIKKVENSVELLQLNDNPKARQIKLSYISISYKPYPKPYQT
ncbi:endonuclease [Helicobacter pylori Hp P-13]|uniref:Endonuclease n=2 Tax=Helicobacter pylori TaxID=210 RepID=A0ABC9QQ66_HELPX|nr:hypothetical protein [Helicobacter pylori]EJC05375.1 endonuclease [Helicobacter pylori Hp P-13]EJC30601.1 endonuclease [Helicobacter pylori Hp P-13b]